MSPSFSKNIFVNLNLTLVHFRLTDKFEFDDTKKGRIWKEKFAVSELLLLVKGNFIDRRISTKHLGMAMKQAFPGVKRQHTASEPYSYYGLKLKETIATATADQAAIFFEHVACQTDPCQQHNKPKDTKSVECQAAEVSAYNIPQSVYSDIPKDRYIDRKMLVPIGGGESLMGEGTFARVSMMVYRKLPVAVKEYKEHASYSLNSLRNRAVKEARTLINITPHYSIPLLFGVILNSRPFSLVMQLCTRHDSCITILKLLRSNTENVTDGEKLSIMEKLALGLHHVHCNGFLHNDLKTDNVAIVKFQIVADNGDQTREWNPMILDFGEATRASVAIKRKYQSFHSHVDPDILSGQEVHSTNSDIFSLGVIMKKVAESMSSGSRKDKLLEVCETCRAKDNRPNAEMIADSIKTIK